MAEAEALQRQLDEEKEQSSKLRDEVSDKTTLLECLFQETAADRQKGQKELEYRRKMLQKSYGGV